MKRGISQNNREASTTPLDGMKANENVQVLLDSLRDNYIIYKEYAMRCQLELRTQNSAESHKYFYFPPKIPMLEEPEKQKIYRKKYIQDVTSLPEPEPLVLLADVLHKSLLESIGDRSNPNITRQDLAIFFKRRLSNLQHKKYKILGRWSNHIMTAAYLEKTSLTLDQCMGRLQQEIDICLNRVERLSQDDNYLMGKQGNRPHPTAKEDDKDSKPLYLESNSQSLQSSIRLDDVESYLRITTYRNKILRLANKLVTDIKWLPYSGRFDIWNESRYLMFDFKESYHKRRYKIYNEVCQKIRARLEHSGVVEEKVINTIIDKFTRHLKGKEFQTRSEQIQNSFKCDYECPPIIVSNLLELKIYLIDIAREFGITGDLEIDSGHSFTYQISVFFPTHFQKQILELQFDWHDTGKDEDQETVEKIARNLGLRKQDAILNMSKFSESERNKSILGRINNNDISGQFKNNGVEFDRKKYENIEFFTLDETDYKLKRADWLDAVCFRANVPEYIKRQSHYLNQVSAYDSLLESAFNFLDVNDGGAVNKIFEESSTTHAQRATKRNQVRSENPMFKVKEDDLQNNLKNAVNKPPTIAEQIKIAEQPLLEPIPSHIVKAYYTLRYLKTRDFKIKLLHILNYFRSIQKRLALDVQQFCSRERAVGDQELINPQFGKDSNGNPRSMLNGNNGPGNIFQNHIMRQMDSIDQDKDKTHPVSIKSLKYLKKFNPQISSTCPSLPIMHVTFGRPRLFEELSESIDNEKLNSNPSKESRLYSDRSDKVIINYESGDVTVFDEYGIKIIYEESLNDVLELEEELLKIGSFYINKHEFVLDSDIKEPQSAIDRAELAYNLISEETKFQFEKVKVIQQYIECYEHVCDPVEQLRIMQMIVDMMSQRPRLNLEATYFIDSYKNEVEVLIQRRELFRELLDVQIEIEENENTQVRKFQELKFRKLQDHMRNAWKYEENLEREQKVSSQEDEAKKAVVTDKLKDRLEQKGILDPDKRQRMKEIAQRHITEYANNQYLDFQDVLGIPEVTAEQLFNNQAQKEPLIVDTLREHGFFQKQMDGYPWYFSKKKQRVQLRGISERHIGILDFYESLVVISKVNAAIVQSQEELVRAHQSENGLAHSCIERAILMEIRGKMKIIRNITIDSDYLVSKSTPKIEEDLYFSSSDKLIFLMREMKSHFNPDQIYEKVNPLLVGKLDIESVTKFNFPRLKIQDLPNKDELTPEEIVRQMIDMAKITVSSMTLEEKLIGGNIHIEDFMEKKGKSTLPEVVNQPSMMIMSCNLIEVLRLREELIQAIHESDVLSIIYKQQLKIVNKDSFKLILTDAINFDTQQIVKDNMNLIDSNDGLKLDFDLAFREFDATLKANLDFKSQSCIKALMLDLGVEELRAVLHYQLMHTQVLHVAVRLNQQIMDACQRGLCELDFLTNKKQITVPNTIVNLGKILSKGGDGYNSEALNRERNNLRQILQREIGDNIYLMNSKKARQRPYIIKRFTNVLGKVQTFTTKSEVKLRILRSYRLKLCHSYCKDILREVYQDSIKIQTLQAANQLRQRSRLLPKDSNIFMIGLGGIYENISSQFIQNSSNLYKNHQKFNISNITNAKFDTLFYIPSSDEILEIETKIDENKELQLQNQAQYTDQINEQLLDYQIKDMVKLSVDNVHFKADEGQSKSIRKVSFNEAYSYNSLSLKLLNYLTLILRVFNLEYYMGRNNSPGLDVLEMEDLILAGRIYWELSDKDMGFQNVDYSNQAISDIVINKIVSQRRARVDLAEDLNQISRRLRKLNEWPKRFMIENLKMETIIDLLASHQQMLYNQFLYGLEALEDTFLDKKNDEGFSKINEIREKLLRKRSGFSINENGFDMSLVNVNPYFQNLENLILKDNKEFVKIYQPVVDEEYLIPKEISLIKNLFSQEFSLDNQYQYLMNRSYYGNYTQLENSFLNLKDSDRAYVYTNFYQIDEMMDDYLSFKGLSNDKLISPAEIISNKLEFLQLKVEQKLLQKLLICWISQSDIPKDTNSFERQMKVYKDQVLMKILQERDLLNELHLKAKEKQLHMQPEDSNKKTKTELQQEQGIKVSKEAIFDAFNQNLQHQATLDRVNERKAEINVIRREMEIRLIKHSIQMIKNEHTSLLATFEQAAGEKDVAVFVHPQQQFASTLFQSVDRNSHLDVSTKLAFVQQFLTRLRNRCTEVETLTSGPGVVFSMKDFNECLQIFCKGLLKYGEQELRTRIETQHLRESRYKHMLYLKEQQNVYYKRKCEAFLSDIDKLINSKLTQKGNQIIYELDISNRELRMLKDNFYMMEKLMRQEIRHEYERTIQEKENTIHKFKESFLTYKSELNNEIKEEVAKEIMQLDKKVKNAAKRESSQGLGSFRGQASNKFRQLGLNNTNQFSDYNQLSSTSSKANLNAGMQSQYHTQGYYDAESMREINSLHRYIRKYKILAKMKEVLAIEKHERELYNQRQKLTSNECLWEQLAEAEKREQIIRQELYYTQQSLASYEKLIEKLQQQLENLQNQKLRLQQYKNSKSKRIEELESKMRDIEIMENIDLNKVLEELRMRDKKLKTLAQVDRNFGEKLEIANKANDKRLKEMEGKYKKEKEMKEQAFTKLDNLRLEMRALEGRDFSNDLWKDKCKELFDICKDLQSENDQLKEAILAIQKGQNINSQLQTLNQQNLDSNFKQKGLLSPTTSQKIVYQNESGSKPSSTVNLGGQSRLYSRGGQGGVLSGLQQYIDPTLTSGLSLPDINGMDLEDKVNILNSTQQFQTQMNFNRNRFSNNLTLKSNQGGVTSDIIKADAFTSTGTISDQTRKFNQTGVINFANTKNSIHAAGDLQSQMQATTTAEKEGLSNVNSGEMIGFQRGYRNNMPQVFGSQQLSQSQSRGTALLAQQNQTKFKQKRLKTSQGGRRQQQQNATQSSQGSQFQNFKDTIPTRMSGGPGFNFNKNSNLTSTNLVGQQIAHGLFGSAIPTSGMFKDNRGSINLNINFNTTNITMPKNPQN